MYFVSKISFLTTAFAFNYLFYPSFKLQESSCKNITKFIQINNTFHNVFINLNKYLSYHLSISDSIKMLQQNISINLDIFQVEHYVTKYQSMLFEVGREKDGIKQILMEVQTSQQFNHALQSIKEKFNYNTSQLEDALKKLVYLSQCYIVKQQQHKNIRIANEHTIAQNNSQIESQKYQIAYLKDKVKSADQHVEKLSLQLTDLQQKVGNIDTYFEKQKFKLENLIQKSQIDQQKSSEQFLSQLRQSQLTLTNMLHLTKKQKSQQQSVISELNDQITILQNKLSKLQGKYQYEIRKKQSLEKELKERLQMMDQMQQQINDLRDVLRNPFQRLSHDDSGAQLQFVHEEMQNSQQKVQVIPQTKQQFTNNFSQQVQEYGDQYVNMDDIRGSFIHKLDQMGIKLDSAEKQCADDLNRPSDKSLSSSSMRKISFDSMQQRILQKLKIQEKPKVQQNLKNQVIQQKQNKGINNNLKQVFEAVKKIEKSSSELFANRNSAQQNPNKSKFSKALSIGNTRKHNNFRSFGYEQNEQRAPTSIEHNRAVNMKKGLQNIIPANRSQLKTKAGNYKKVPIQLDPYYSHFILTSQSVKIRQDIQDLLNIDVKPFYKEILDKRIPMHLWDQWIRNKLRELWKENKESP